jgi:hypothetical protein
MSDHDAPEEDSQGHEGIEPLISEIKHQYGESLVAILVYGSWLRGKRDTMLDFYVLVEDYRTLGSMWQAWMCRLLPPNVYQIHHEATPGNADAGELRAKYALMTLKQFCRAMKHDFHSYFWARFAQPCEIIFVREESTRTSLENAFNTASATFLQRVLPSMPDLFSSRELWTGGLSHTYRCELRTESSNRPDSLYEFNPAYYEEVTRSMARLSSGPGLSITAENDRYSNQSSVIARKCSAGVWWLRRVQGKLLSILRLMKAALTFNDPLQYLLWKIERHTGIYIKPSPRQLKYPLIFAWPLLLKLYKRGAFR